MFFQFSKVLPCVKHFECKLLWKYILVWIFFTPFEKPTVRLSEKHLFILLTTFLYKNVHSATPHFLITLFIWHACNLPCDKSKHTKSPPDKQTNAPLHWQICYLHQHVLAWGCFLQTPEPTVFSLANVLAVIHHHRSDGSWISHPSQSHQHAASSSLRGADVLPGKLWFISVIHCSFCSPCAGLLRLADTRPSPPQPPWWRVPHASRCDAESGHALDELKSGILRNYCHVINPGRQPEVH